MTRFIIVYTLQQGGELKCRLFNKREDALEWLSDPHWTQGLHDVKAFNIAGEIPIKLEPVMNVRWGKISSTNFIKGKKRAEKNNKGSGENKDFGETTKPQIKFD